MNDEQELTRLQNVILCLIIWIPPLLAIVNLITMLLRWLTPIQEICGIDIILLSNISFVTAHIFYIPFYILWGYLTYKGCCSLYKKLDTYRKKRLQHNTHQGGFCTPIMLAAALLVALKLLVPQ